MDCEKALHLHDSHPVLMDKICEEIVESICDPNRTCSIPEGDDGAVYIADIQAINAINHVAVGSFWLDGIEYSFEVESGNHNGFVWRSVSEEAPIPDIKIVHQRYALEPSLEIVSKHILEGRQALLLAKWDAMVAREPFASIPSKFAYDVYFCPTDRVGHYWKAKAAKGGFVITTESEARATWERLASGC